MGARLEEERDFWKVHPYAPLVSPQDVPSAGIFDCPTLSICVNAEWGMRILGLLEVLYQDDAWKGNPAEVQAAKDNVLEIWSEALTTIGCAPSTPAIEFNTSLELSLLVQQNLLEQFNTGGLDGVAPDRPDTTFDSDTADTTQALQDQRKKALCLACTDYVTTVMNEGQGLAVQYGLQAAEAALPLLAFPPLGISVIGAIGLLTVAAQAGLGQRDIRDHLACCMVDALTGQTITQAAFGDSLEACENVPSGLTGQAVHFFVESTTDDMGNFLTFVKGLGAYMGAAANVEIPCPCDACAGIPALTDFEGGMPSYITFFDSNPAIPVAPRGSGREGGEWRAGIGRIAGDAIAATDTGVDCDAGGCIFNASLFIKVDPNCEITRVRWWHWHATGGLGRRHQVDFFDVAGNLVLGDAIQNSYTAAAQSWNTALWQGSVTGVTWIRIYEEARTGWTANLYIDDVEIDML